jgi:hypothetical protein
MLLLLCGDELPLGHGQLCPQSTLSSFGQQSRFMFRIVTFNHSEKP